MPLTMRPTGGRAGSGVAIIWLPTRPPICTLRGYSATACAEVSDLGSVPT